LGVGVALGRRDAADANDSSGHGVTLDHAGLEIFMYLRSGTPSLSPFGRPPLLRDSG
jgi:hypothetical protein